MSLNFRLKKAYRKFVFNLSASGNPLFLAYCRCIYKPESGTVEEFLDKYSGEHKQIVFLQVGANDGFINDPLHKFIKRDRWKGVLLEPQQDVFNNYLARLYRKTPEVIPVNAALDKTDGARIMYKLGISNERWATGLSSFSSEVLKKKMEDGSMMKNIRRQGISLPENIEEAITTIEVPTISPGSLLKMLDNVNFNVLAIDTEGFDFEILKMLDLGIISPEVIIYEESNFNETTKRECRAYLENHGYSCRTIRRDVLAVKK